VIVVDACSTDGTAEIARQSATVLTADTGLTRARLLGTEAASGEFVLNLDSDQILTPRALEAARGTSCPVVAFGEESSGTSLVARINRLDKSAMNTAWQRNIDPVSGFIRPRYYRRDLLLDALRRIPPRILDVRPCPFSEDSLIYWHTQIAPDRVGFVPDAILHEEEAHLLPYLKKWRLYGQTAKYYRGTPYSVFATQRGKRRVDGLGKLATAPGLLMRAGPFILGYYL
jgi:glycosyltransferase involved in cell wall biosynthesis